MCKWERYKLVLYLLDTNMSDQQLTMTSIALQYRHTDVYKSFFYKHTIVLSTSHVLRWSPSVTRATWSLKLKQKLPARMYLWISFTPDVAVQCKKMHIYQQSKHNFDTFPANQIIPHIQMFEEYIQQYLKKNGYAKWITIDVLSEYGRWYWFGFAGVFSTLLASAMHVLLDDIDLENVQNNYAHFMQSSEFASICELATEIDTHCMWKKYSSSAYVSLHTTSWPLIHASWLTQSVTSAYGHQAELKRNEIWSLYEVTNVQSKSHIPIDYGILHFGTPHDTQHTYGTYADFSEVYSQTNTFLKEIWTQLGIDMDGMLEWTYDIHNLTTFFSVRILSSWEKMLQQPFDKWSIQEFIQTFVDAWLYNSLIEREYKNLMDTYYYFDTIKSSDEEKIWLVPLSSWKYWWSFLFVVPYQKSRQTLWVLCEQLQERWYNRACFSYLSWRDGVSNEWLVIEQHVDKKIYSQYIDADHVLLIKAGWASQIVNHSQVLTDQTTWLVLDDVYKKVYMWGEKLTHKHLRSQSATVEVLDILLEHVWEFIHNSEFPVSSYSKNKNEMIWKIVLPLKNLIKESFWQDISLECSGSIYDFHMKLEGDHGLLHRIKKVNTA